MVARAYTHRFAFYGKRDKRSALSDIAIHSAQNKERKSRFEQQNPKVDIQNAEQGHQHHQQQVRAFVFEDERADIQRNGAAEQSRNQQFARRFLGRFRGVLIGGQLIRHGGRLFRIRLKLRGLALYLGFSFLIAHHFDL